MCFDCQLWPRCSPVSALPHVSTQPLSKFCIFLDFLFWSFAFALACAPDVKAGKHVDPYPRLGSDKSEGFCWPHPHPTNLFRQILSSCFCFLMIHWCHDGDTQRLPDSPFQPSFVFLFTSLSLFLANDHSLSLLSTHRFPRSTFSTLSLQLLPNRAARWLISLCTFPDKPGASCEALPSSPNTSVTAPQPKQATAMKNVLAGFGSGVSKPPNRSSPAPAAAQNAQNANQAPNPASAFSGLVNNISNSAKKEQGSFEQIFFWRIFFRSSDLFELVDS